MWILLIQCIWICKKKKKKKISVDPSSNRLSIFEFLMLEIPRGRYHNTGWSLNRLYRSLGEIGVIEILSHLFDSHLFSIHVLTPLPQNISAKQISIHCMKAGHVISAPSNLPLREYENMAGGDSIVLLNFQNKIKCCSRQNMQNELALCLFYMERDFFFFFYFLQWMWM